MIYLVNNTGNTIAVNLNTDISGQTYILKLEKDDESLTLSGLTDTSLYPLRYSKLDINISLSGTGFYDYNIYNSGNTVVDYGLAFVKFNEPTIKEYTITKKVKTYKK